MKLNKEVCVKCKNEYADKRNRPSFIMFGWTRYDDGRWEDGQLMCYYHNKKCPYALEHTVSGNEEIEIL